MPPGHEVVAQFMSEKDEDDGEGIGKTSDHQSGGYRQYEENNMYEIPAHEKILFLFLMTIPV
jgi:hypothetical protein